MQCTRCGHEIELGAKFCSNCGLGVPAPNLPPAGDAVPTITGTANPLSGAPEKSKRVSGKIIAAIATGLILLLLGSLFLAYSLARDSQKQSADKPAGSSSQAAGDAGLKTIATPCYSTKISTDFDISNTTGSCALEAAQSTGGETIFIKAIAARTTYTEAQFAVIAKEDVKNVLSALPGTTIISEGGGTFAGDTAYTFDLGRSEGKGSGKITYVRHTPTNGFNVFIVGRLASGSDASLTDIESNWKW